MTPWYWVRPSPLTTTGRSGVAVFAAWSFCSSSCYVTGTVPSVIVPWLLIVTAWVFGLLIDGA